MTRLRFADAMPWLAALMLMPAACGATPANRLALSRHYGRFLVRALDNCATCHLPLQPGKTPTSLADFPHNPFGKRLRLLGEDLRKAGKRHDLETRLRLAAREDADGDGVDNETELLLGSAPGDASSKPDAKRLAAAPRVRTEFAAFLAGYRWRPFEPVRRPAIPVVRNRAWVRNPIDAFVAAEHERRGLKPRPEASKEVLLRRVTIDLTGLNPTLEEQRAFLADRRPGAYERLVDRLLASPRYGVRWGRHWMDVWRYSDWAGWSDGGQIRDSKPFIWRWRDWIVESLNADRGYDRMLQEMLSADEMAPDDPDALRATGFLVRNFKLLSREQWLEDTINHTSRAFLGVTMHCAKCHDHMYDPIGQEEYYKLRAIFEPHNVRTDRVPGQPDVAKDGLVHAYDAEPAAPTYLFIRGDERNPDKDHKMAPGVPACLGGKFEVKPVKLPLTACRPERRDFVIRETAEASEKALADSLHALAALDSKAPAEKRALAEKTVAAAESRHTSLLAALKAERLEDSGRRDSPEWKVAATAALAAQRRAALLDAELSLATAQDAARQIAQAPMASAGKKVDPVAAAKAKVVEAEKALAAAKKESESPLTTAYKPRSAESFPAESTGRRLAFARWLTDSQNPLTARVAVNHIWARHFGQGIVPSLSDFGRNGRPPSHPDLLDWLAAELCAPSRPTIQNPKSKTENGPAPLPPNSGGFRAEGHASGRVGLGQLTNIPPFLSARSAQPVGRSRSRVTDPPGLGGRGASPALRSRGTGLTEYRGWSMKHIHRLIVTSAAYRMASTPDATDLAKDPDNTFLWRMSSRRLEAEAVRDNVLYASGGLDETMGGPEVDYRQALASHRRSIYIQIAAEKESAFLKAFDGPSVTECYERKPSVMPQQALALANSELTLARSKALAAALNKETGPDSPRFIQEAFLRVLARRPTAQETRLCQEFLTNQARRAAPVESGVKPATLPAPDKPKADSALRAREDLILVLFNHNDFVTVR